ncbi:MAG: hypothetical protein P4L31_01290 [Candidatus Babeliales bacterium]|nr:hypothetical protein [Candidatus Babeliales bacterium]
MWILGKIKEEVAPSAEQKLAQLLKEKIAEKPFEEQLKDDVSMKGAL